MDSTSQLVEAINSATDSRLRKVLIQLCEDSASAKDLVSKALFLPSRDGKPSSPNQTNSKKRKRYEICMECDQEYDVKANDEAGTALCVFHLGKFCWPSVP